MTTPRCRCAGLVLMRLFAVDEDTLDIRPKKRKKILQLRGKTEDRGSWEKLIIIIGCVPSGSLLLLLLFDWALSWAVPRERLQRGISEYVFLGGEDSEFLRNCSERRNVFNINHIELNDALRGVRREGAGIFVTKDFRFGTESVRCSTVRLCPSYSMIVFFLLFAFKTILLTLL